MWERSLRGPEGEVEQQWLQDQQQQSQGLQMEKAGVHVTSKVGR